MLEQLTTIQLIKILTKDYYTRNIFKGVFARNQLPRKLYYPTCFIINTDNSNKPGEHWLAFYYDSNGICDFFDSFGLHPKIYRLENFLNKSSNNWNYNKIQYQQITSNSCGYYCFIFLLFKARGIEMDQLEIDEKKLNNVFKNNKKKY